MSDSPPDPPSSGRRWTLEGARAVFPDVRDRTARAVAAVDALLEGHPENAMEQDPELRARVEREVSRWVREMEALGADVKGMWLVDFDNGSGYYCWKHPEPELCHFHTYEDGFSGRSRIQ